MTDIVMPRLSDTMEEGTILRWLKSNGDELARGEELVEIETDKANMTYESDQSGVLQILAAAGDTLAVGQVIARVSDGELGTPDERPSSRTTASGERSSDEPVAGGERVKASPLARRIAGESGIDLRGLTGSGPGGRIVKADVVAAPKTQASRPGALGQTAGAAAGAQAHLAPPGARAAAERGDAAAPTLAERVATAKGEMTVVELSRTQQAVARRMAESKATIPDFTLQIDVDMEECVKLRAQLKQLSTPGGAGEPRANAHDVPTYNDMIVKASALALREHPRANGSYRDGRVQVYSRVNVGVAVAAEGALVVPTVFDADEKSVGEIARETRALAERVRAGTITPPELGGGTFTVSNLGMYGVKSFTAIINPPQAGILSVGALAPRAVVVAGGTEGGAQDGGAVLARSTLMLTLACDHRILYGAEAAQFLARIRELLESPSALTL